MRNSSRLLTAKQLRWIDEYLIDFNGAAAAVRAGYSAKCARSIAHENLTKPDLQAILRDKQIRMAADLEIRRNDVVLGLVAAVELGRQKREPAAMVAAIREIAKILGFYSPGIPFKKLPGQRSAASEFASMSDAQLHALCAGRCTSMTSLT